jgi:hypothetical protein
MRLRVVSGKSEIPNLNPNEKMVHLAFSASIVDFLNLMQRCPRLRTIQVPYSIGRQLSNAIQVFLEIQKKAKLGADLIKYIAKTIGYCLSPTLRAGGSGSTSFLTLCRPILLVVRFASC